jgi:WD40 repeat protein
VAVTTAPLRRFKGHKACAHGLAFTPDGMQLLSGSCDTTLMLWDTHAGSLVTQFKGVLGQVFALDIAPQGRFAVSGGRTTKANVHDLQVWDLQTFMEVGRLPGHTGVVTCLKFSPDGKWIASGDTNGTIRLWEVPTRKPIRSLETGAGVHSVAFSPDGTRLLSGGGLSKAGRPGEYLVRLWDVATGKEIMAASGHTHRITSVAFLADPRFAVSSSGRVYRSDKELPVDPFVRLWDLESGKEVGRFIGSKEGVASLTITLDKKYVFCAAGDDRMHLCELKGGEEIHRYEGHLKKVLCVAITRNSHYVATGSEDGQLLLWDLPKSVHIPLEMMIQATPSSQFSPQGTKKQ